MTKPPQKPYHPFATFYTIQEALSYIDKHNLDAHIWSETHCGKHHVMLNDHIFTHRQLATHF